MLGLAHVDNLSALNAAYRPLIRQWHPDRHHDSAGHDDASERAKAINAAYAYLALAIERGEVPPAPRGHRPHTPRAARGAGPGARASTPASKHDRFPDDSVLEIFVKSSSIASVGYDSAAQFLYMRFHGGTVYKYFEVPQPVFEALLNAPSRGAYANSHIIYRYRYEKVA